MLHVSFMHVKFGTLCGVMSAASCCSSAGVQVPCQFPEDFQPVFGMSVQSCVDYYNGTAGPGDWDIGTVAAEVQEVKGRLYHELTAGGIQAFSGARALIMEARSLGMTVGLASSGTCIAFSIYYITL